MISLKVVSTHQICPSFSDIKADMEKPPLDRLYQQSVFFCMNLLNLYLAIKHQKSKAGGTPNGLFTKGPVGKLLNIVYYMFTIPFAALHVNHIIQKETYSNGEPIRNRKIQGALLFILPFCQLFSMINEIRRFSGVIDALNADQNKIEEQQLWTSYIALICWTTAILINAMTPFKKCYNQDFEKTDRQNNAVAVYNNVFYLVRMGLRFWRLNDKHWQITVAACSLDAFRFLTVQILIHAIKRNEADQLDLDQAVVKLFKEIYQEYTRNNKPVSKIEPVIEMIGS